MLTATCAPELPGAADFYRAAASKGVRLNAGHSNATWTEMAAAHTLGLRHVDHLYCAMSSVSSLRERCGTPMQASMLEFVLATADMTTEVIATANIKCQSRIKPSATGTVPPVALRSLTLPSIIDGGSPGEGISRVRSRNRRPDPPRA